MNSKESISSLVSQCFQLLIIIREIICVAPWKQNQLAVTVDAVIEDPITSPIEKVVAHMNSLNLWPGFRTMISVTAFVIGRSSFIPMEPIVSVGIYSLNKHLLHCLMLILRIYLAAKYSTIIWSSLPPHSVVVPGIGIAIRIVRSKEVPVKSLSQISMGSIILNNFLQHPGQCSRWDPFSSSTFSFYCCPSCICSNAICNCATMPPPCQL